MAAFLLVLGTPLNAKPKPWNYMGFGGVMVNAFDLMQHGVSRFRGRRLRRHLGIDDDVELWIDSGGYQFLKRGVHVSVERLAKLYREVDADYYVSLDYPPGANISWEDRAYYIARTVNSFLRLRSMLRDYTEEGRLVPVIHMATGNALRIQLACYNSVAEVASIGGLVPYFMQRAGRGSRLKAVLFLELARRLWNGRLHALGVASAAIIPLLRGIGVESSDTQTWRLKAAYGKIIVPGLGERHVSSKPVGFGPAVLSREEEPVVMELARIATRRTGVEITLEKLRSDFSIRATFNAFVLRLVAENHQPYGGRNKAFANLYVKIAELKKMSTDVIENELDKLLVEEARRAKTGKLRVKGKNLEERGGELVSRIPGGEEEFTALI